MFCPLSVRTHFSLLRSTCRPKTIAKLAANRGMKAVGITDVQNLGGAVDFFTALTDQKVKPIFGCQFSLCEGNPTDHSPTNDRPYSQTLVLAKNLNGWRKLLMAVSRSNSREYTFHGPRLSLEDFRDFSQGGDLIAISGFPGSDIANGMFTNPKAAYSELDPDEVRNTYVVGLNELTWRDNITRRAEQYLSVFGKDNFFLSTQVTNPSSLPSTVLIAKAIRQLGGKLRVPVVATPCVNYINNIPQDAFDQRVLLCAGMKTTLQEVERRVKREDDHTIGMYFGRGNGFYFPTEEEMLVHHTRGEVEMSAEIADMCESYSILKDPELPDFPCPDGMNAESYLRELCEKGWQRKIMGGGTLPFPIEDYRQRLEMELGVIGGAGLSSYFLIVQDFINYAKMEGWLVGSGRGSSAGCLVSYLSGITGIDPLKYGLIFERFLNVGRAVAGKISLPDIDSDVPKYKREELYHYLQKKYGEDRVAKIATFSSMQGRSAITEVLRVKSEQFDTIKRITKFIPGKEKISEELEEMRQAGEEPSIIKYALETYPDELREWVEMDESGECTGIYGSSFAQAIRLEGVKTHIGTHAAGVVIGARPLAEVCPLKWDESVKSNIAAMEYPALEKMGLCKLDLLAVAFLDKLQGVRSLLRRGKITDVY